MVKVLGVSRRHNEVDEKSAVILTKPHLVNFHS